MSKKQYILTSDDISEYKKIKKTPIYKEYISSIINSPILLSVVNEHIKDLDIVDDIEDLIESGINSKQLSDMFKNVFKSVAVNIVADTLILNDIVDISFNDAILNIESDFKVKYILGLAEKETYDQAEKIITENNDKSSPMFIGYSEYMKKQKLVKNFDSNQINSINITKKTAKPTQQKQIKKNHINIDMNDIEI
jgi:hypothetical protein